MEDATVHTISDQLVHWGIAGASGMSSAAEVIVEHLDGTLAGKTAAAQSYIDYLGRQIVNLTAKSQFAMEASGATAEVRAVNASLIAEFGRQANILSDVRYDNITRLKNFTADLESKIGIGKLASVIGPLVEGVHLIEKVIEEGVGSDSVAEVSTSIAAAETLATAGGIVAGIVAVGVGISAAPMIAAATVIGAFAGGFLGSAYGPEIYQNLLKPAAEKIPPEFWDKYFDYGGKVADAIPTKFWDALFGGAAKISDWVNKKFRDARKNPSPIIFDLDGDGIEISQLDGGSILFDHNADGIRTATAWASADDGMLVYDRDGNGTIDTGRELFGDSTLLADGSIAADGYAAMRDLDSSVDGQLTAADAAFSSLRVWRDLDQDGVSDQGELFTLAALGVAQIGLEKTAGVTYLNDGTRLDGIGQLTMNGQIRNFTDAWYADNPFFSEFTTPVVISEAAAALPAVNGSGAVRSLQEAATESAALAELLVQFQEATSSDGQRALIDRILKAWADTSPLTTVAEWEAAGHPVTYWFYYAEEPAIWPARLAVLEAFNGANFYPLQTTGVTAFGAGRGRQADLEQSYAALVESVYGALVRQTRLRPYLDAIESTVVDGVLTFSASPVQAMLEQKRLVDERGATQDLAELLRFASPVLLAAGMDPSAVLRDWFLAMPTNSSLRTEILDSLVAYGYFRLDGTAVAERLDGLAAIDGRFAHSNLRGYGGNDTLVGGFGNNTLAGGDGADVYQIDKFGGHDRIENEDGDAPGSNADVLELNMLRSDVTLTRSGEDLRIAAIGFPDDIVVASYFLNDGTYGTAVELIRFSDGQVLNIAQVKGQVLLATGGNDSITGYATNDNLGGAEGNDKIVGAGGNDSLDGGSGNDTLSGGTGSDTYSFGLGSGRDVIDNSSTDAVGTKPDTLQFGTGILAADLKVSRSGADLVLTIVSSGESVVVSRYFYGDATTTTAIDVVRFWNGTVLTPAQIKAAVLVPSSGADYLAGYGSNADLLSGGLGDDTLVGGGGKDTLLGGAGADNLEGGSGSDTFNFDLGGGTDTIISDGDDASVDTLSFGSGISLANLIITRVGVDLVLAVTATSDKVVVKDYFTPHDTSHAGPDLVRFFGGSTLDAAAIKTIVTAATSGNDYIVGYDTADSFSGGAGQDTLYGYAGNDTLDGGVGNDLLYGGQGADTYRFQLGGGSDFITNQDGVSTGPSSDTLELGAGITSANITVTNYGEALKIAVNGTSDQVLIENYFRDDGLGPDGLGTIRFADSSVLSLATIRNLVLTSTSGDDYLSGFASDDSISGGAGIDILTGKGGNDTLDGGTGNDLLTGNSGNNVYRFGRGDGRDTINGAESGLPTRLNTIQFKAGVLPSDIVISRDTSSLLLTIAGTSDVLTIWSFFRDDDPFNPYNPVQQVTFTEGTSWSVADIFAQWKPTSAGPDNARGTYGADVINGGSGADTISGGAGADTLLGGTDADSLTGDSGDDSLLGESGEDRLFGIDGNDILDGGAGNDMLDGGLGDDQFNVGTSTGRDSISDPGGVDKLLLGPGIAQADVTLFRDGIDLVVAVAATAAQTRIVGHFAVNGGIERIQFNDDSFWNAAAIVSRTVGGSANAAAGTSGNDVFVVDNAGDTITEGAGQGIDLVNSSVSYVLGANLENLTLTGYVDLAGTGNTLSNVVTGSAGDNRLNGGLGLDTLAGGAGNDTYVVNDPDNAGVYDTPSDTIVENAGEGTDRVVIVGGAEYNYTLASNVEELYVTNVLNGWTTFGGTYIYRTLTGNALNNTIDFDSNSTFGAIIDGGSGADTLRGSASSDIYVVDNAGDVVEELRGGALTSPYSAQDWVWSSISYTLGPWLENLRLTGSAVATGTGNDLNNTLDGSYNSAANVLGGGLGSDLYVLGPGDTVVEAASEGVDTVEFNYAPTDGILHIADTGAASIEFYRVAQGLGGGLTLVGTNQDENLLYAGATVDGFGTVIGGGTLHGGGGNDTLTGYNGPDTLQGGTGDDVLSGAYGNDQLEGEEGDDTLDGGMGNDVYLFSRGDGSDVIQEAALADPAKLNMLRFGIAIPPSDIIVQRDGDDVTFAIRGTLDKVTVRGFFVASNPSGPGNPIQQVQFADNSSWGLGVIRALANPGLVNTAPTLAIALPDVVRIEGSPISLDLPPGSFADLDLGDALSYGANLADGSPLPSWLAFDPANGRFGGVATVPGTVSVRLTASDYGGLAASDVFTITVSTQNKTLTGTAGVDYLDGMSGNDTLTGFAGNDRLDGRAGADSMVGGTGDDAYGVDNAGDVVVENAGEGTYDGVVSTLASYVLPVNVEQLSLAGNAFAGTGNAAANLMQGSALDNRLDGGGGADTFYGGGGNDIYVVDTLGDTITPEFGVTDTDTVESSISWTLQADLENLLLIGSNPNNGTGNAAANVLTGNGGNNVLDGSLGADTLIGSAGSDIYLVDNSADVVNEGAGAGTDLVQSSASFTLSANVENLTLTGSTAFSAIGNASANLLTGNGIDNLIDGGTGIDTMVGGAGNDTYVVDHIADVTTELVGAGIDLVQSTANYTLGANLENLTLMGSSAINGTGNTLANLLTGNSGNNVLNGGAGADTLTGGLGNDTYVVDDAADVTSEAAGEGTDLVQASVNWSLSANIESLALTSTALNGAGNTLNNAIQGNANNNRLDGGGGSDAMTGGAGNDTYVVDAAGDTTVEIAAGGTDTVESSVNWTLGTEVENLLLTGAGAISGTGNALANILTGNGGANTLSGAPGNDTLDGGAGDDVLDGGFGNDTYQFGRNSGSDTINALDTTAGRIDTLQLGVGVLTTDVLLTRLVDDLVVTIRGTSDVIRIRNHFVGSSAGGNQIDQIRFNDTTIWNTAEIQARLTATNHSPILNAAIADQSVMQGTTFNLTFPASNFSDPDAGDTLTYSATLSNGNPLPSWLTFTPSTRTFSGISTTATPGTSSIRVTAIDAGGLSASDVFDLIVQAATGFVVTGTTGNDFLLAGSLNDTVDGLGGDDTLYGGIGDNLIYGQAGNDQLFGAEGLDTLVGGAGSDTFYADAVDVIVEAAGEGYDYVYSSVDYIMTPNVEQLILQGTATHATGNAQNNVFNTNVLSLAGFYLDGGGGVDTMFGALGNDTFVVDNAADVVVEYTTVSDGTTLWANTGVDTVRASVSYDLAWNVENLVLTGTDAINGTGNEQVNTITGNPGANVLSGVGLNDTLIGGAGDDTYVVADASTSIVELAGGGIDTVASSIDWTLGSQVENLTLAAGAVAGIGNASANVLTGNALANILDGGAGADTLIGGLGDDSYVVADVLDVVTENASEGLDTIVASLSVTLAANVENLVLTGSAALNGMGNVLDNLLTGNAAENTLTGGAGNDTLDGGAGLDTLIGGLGNDIYVVDNALDVVNEAVGEGTDTIEANFNYSLGNGEVEGLTLTGAAARDGTGNALANTLRGNSQANRLDGGAGIDTLIGAQGEDVYVVDNSADVVTEVAGEGIDLVQASASYALGVEVENLWLLGGASLAGTGNALANVLTGNAAANTLDGGAGDDTMIGGLGDDTYVIDALTDVITENAGEGIDTLRTAVNGYTLGANLENLALIGAAFAGTGNASANVMTGHAGANTLDGGGGADTMIGGAGNDTYIVDAAGEQVVENVAEGTDIVQSGVSYVLAANIETLTLTGSAAINGTGNAIANTLNGNGADNVLDGGAGNDVLAGGLGNDTYVVDSSGDVITELASAGTDGVQSSAAAYTLGLNVENLLLTGTGNLNGTGNALANLLTGNAGNNRLDGGAGVDTMAGGGGNDVYVVDVLGDAITEVAGGGSDTVETVLNYTLGAELENLLLTSTGNVNGTGNAAANKLTGNGGSNILDGSLGADTLIGGAGNDTYVVDSALDVVTELASAGTDVVQASVTYTLAANVENLLLTGTNAINGTGNTLANRLTGNGGDNILNGGAGIDTMAGGAGNDTYVVEVAGDVTTELASAGTDTVQSILTWTLAANVENLTLLGTSAINGTGNTLANVLLGNGGANRLDGGTGADAMTGGTGNDIYVVDNALDVVTELAGGGTDTVESTVNWTLGAEVEKLTLLGTALNGTGNALANTLLGNASSNRLDGGGGIDAMTGGVGNDTYVVDVAGDTTVEIAAGGTDTVEASVTWTLGTEVENLLLTGTNAINGTGNALANQLTGNGGNNILNGLGGIDTMAGGVGNDTYVVDVAADVTTELASAGTDTVQSIIAWTLGANFENLLLTGTSAINGTGNTLANQLTGNGGDNILNGLGGIDTMAGGAGNDTYLVDVAGDVTTELASAGSDTVQSILSWTLAANVENLTLLGSSAINGTGNTAANVVTGNAANNLLDGGTGADTLLGGLGNDIYVVDNALDVTTELAAGGTDLVQASINWTLAAELENLTLTGTALNGTGNAVANVLLGNAGNNRLDGGAGIDAMTGGAGNDTYVVDALGDTTVEVAAGGTDTVEASLSWTLATEVENLLLTGTSGIQGTGNALANQITGNSGDNVLNGLGGTDTMIGGAGNDAYFVDATTDVITELASAGTDLVLSSATYTLGSNVEQLTLTGSTAINGTGNTFDNRLTGNSGINVLTGAAGNDTLDGAAGADTLVGGTGNDTYVLGRGYGAELIQENDATLGNTDVMSFLAGVTTDQIWFRRVGNDLEVSIIGTSDLGLIQNWYLGTQYHVEQFKTSDGKTLLDSKVQELVNAMAAFTPPALGQLTLPPTYQPALLPVINADWGP